MREEAAVCYLQRSQRGLPPLLPYPTATEGVSECHRQYVGPSLTRASSLKQILSGELAVLQ